MAIFEDILGVIIIVVIFLVAFFMVSTFLVVREVQVLTEEQQNYLRDYYSTSIDTFLSTRSPSTDKPFSLVIGEMIDHSRKQGDFGEIEKIKKEINESLSQIIGKNNFYIEIEPIVSNLTISFVIDGSNSLNEARTELNRSLDTIMSDLNQRFEGDDVIDYEVYNLHHSNLCDDYFSGHSCEDLNKDKLYSDYMLNKVGITKPSFGFNSHEDWLASDSYLAEMDEILREISLNAYYQVDWMTGIAYAHKKFSQKEGSNESYHFIIPITDELSTSSISDYCANSSDIEFRDGYRACIMCHNDCPVDRSNRDFDNIINYINGSMILPVISEGCHFDYSGVMVKITNNRDEEDRFVPFIDKFNLTNANLPINKSNYICNETFDCPGCNISNEGGICYKQDCKDDLIKQMERLANETTGQNTTIKNFNFSILPQQISEEIDILIDSLKLEIGDKEILNASTRFAFEKRVVMPGNQHSEFIVVVRDTPFTAEDSEWHAPDVQQVGIEILKPSSDDQLPTQKIELKVKSTHNADCRFTNDSNDNFNEMEKLTNFENNLHNISYEVDYGQTYTLYFQCNGTSESYNLSDKKIVTFKILDNKCNNYEEWTLCGEGVDCAEGALYNESLNETNRKCCSSCAICETFPQCNETEFCSGHWSGDPTNKCCDGICGNCDTDEFSICNPDSEFCDGNSVIFGGETCCQGDCLNCSDANGHTCLDNEICENGDWLNEDLNCCEEECKDCDGLNKETCETNEICEGDWIDGLERCCEGECKNCTDLDGEYCPTGTANLECKNWIDFSNMCCEQDQCSNCSNKGLDVCNDNQKCVGDIITWEQDCCEGNCKECNELSNNHEICNEDQICDGDYDEILSDCCDGECKDCDEIGNTCEIGQVCSGEWINFEKKCCDSECEEFTVPDTDCNSYWDESGTAPTDGPLIRINEDNPSCALFDVLHPGLVQYVQIAKECCLNSGTNCHGFTTASRNFAGIVGEPNEDELKKCMGRYIIYALGQGRQFAEHYFWQEGCCMNISGFCGDAEPFTCDTTRNSAPPNPSKNGVLLECITNYNELESPPQYPRAWKDNQDWTKNSCYFSDLPASVSLMELKTGQCVDYSVMATTLLRIAGYKEDEVYTLLGPRHAFNLIKFPGDDNYIIFDTTGNAGAFDVGGLSYSAGPYCSYIINPNSADSAIRNFICTNDNGGHSCPPRTQVKGC